MLDLGPPDADLERCFESESNLIPSDLHDDQANVLTDVNLLTNLATEH